MSYAIVDQYGNVLRRGIMPAKKKKMSGKPAKTKAKAKPEPDDEDEDEDEEEEKPKGKKSKNAEPAKKGKKKGGVDWQAMLDSLEAGGANGNILFPKSGKTRIKLVLEDDDDEESWYTEVQGEFEGKVRSRYIIRGCVLFPAQEEKKIMGILVAKTAMKGIVGLLSEGYDLFDPEDGHGITISKTGALLTTSWGITPSPKPVEVEDFEDYSDDGSSLEELEKAMEAINATRTSKTKKKSKGKDGDDEEEADDVEEDW